MIEVITSKSNEKAKFIRSINDKKGRFLRIKNKKKNMIFLNYIGYIIKYFRQNLFV